MNKIDRAKKLEQDRKRKSRERYTGKKDEKNKNRRGNLSKVQS